MDFASNQLGDLALGATGANVSELQAKLNLLGFGPLEVTGAFDDATRAAVLRFQSKMQRASTGSLGAADESLLNQLVLQQQNVRAPSGDTPPAPCPRPLWQTGLMVIGGIALVGGAWMLFNSEEDEGYTRALEPGREEKEVVGRRLNGGSTKCERTPGEESFLKAPAVEA